MVTDMLLKKGRIFNSQHFKIVIKPPTWKHLDIEDDFDMREAKFKLYEELQVLLRDEVLPALDVYEITPSVAMRKPQLTQHIDDGDDLGGRRA